MTIAEAISAAKEQFDWCEGLNCAYGSSVNVGFINYDLKEDEMQFDLYRYGHFEEELEELWNELHREMDADKDSVTYVELLGYLN